MKDVKNRLGDRMEQGTLHRAWVLVHREREGRDLKQTHTLAQEQNSFKVKYNFTPQKVKFSGRMDKVSPSSSRSSD